MIVFVIVNLNMTFAKERHIENLHLLKRYSAIKLTKEFLCIVCNEADEKKSSTPVQCVTFSFPCQIALRLKDSPVAAL